MTNKRLPLLLLLGAALSFGIKYVVKSDEAQLPGDVSVSFSTSDTIAAVKMTEPKQTTTDRPLAAKVALNDLPSEKIETSIAQIDVKLADANAIERLNQNIASEEERAKYQKLFETRDRLQEQRLIMKLADLNQKISDLEKSHASRLEAYGINHEENFAE